MEGVLVHDHWNPYYQIPGVVSHVLCDAHYLRELKALEEIEQESWEGYEKVFTVGLQLQKPLPQGYS